MSVRMRCVTPTPERALVKLRGVMRDALLPQLMSGKIRVKDAEQMVGDVV